MSYCFSTKQVMVGTCVSLGLVLAALAISAGCGRSRTTTDSEGRKVTVTQDGQNSEVTLKGKEGEEVHVESSEAGVPLPDGFPSDIAIYPKATVFASTKDKKGSMSLMLKTGDATQDVMAFYQEKLKQSGWTVENTTNVGDTMMLEVAKEGRKLSMSFRRDAEHTLVTLFVEVVEKQN